MLTLFPALYLPETDGAYLLFVLLLGIEAALLFGASVWVFKPRAAKAVLRNWRWLSGMTFYSIIGTCIISTMVVVMALPNMAFAAQFTEGFVLLSVPVIVILD